MISTNFFDETDSHRITCSGGIFSVLEYDRDISVSPEMAEVVYYSSLLGVRKRQLIANISQDKGVIAQKGRMQLMLGNIEAGTDIVGVGDLVKKFVGSKVTGETAIKPRYVGEGILVLEPTFRHILIEDIGDWEGDLVIEDGMFLACESTVDMYISGRSNISSAALGGEGLFNTTFSGEGYVALESPVPRDELMEIYLYDDVVKIDGNMAIAWSKSLEFTVTRTTPTLVGSLASGEGLVNSFRGTGKILVAPIENNRHIPSPDNKY